MTGDLYTDLLPLLDSPSRDQVRDKAPSGGRVWSFCPCHPDGTKHGRRTLSLHPRFGLTCFANCDLIDIVKALRARNGAHPAHAAPTATYSRNGTARIGGRIVASWVYQDEEGHPLFRVVRLDRPNREKDFLQQHPSGSAPCCRPAADEPCKPAGDGWRWRRGGARYVLYRLPELLAADPAEPLFLVEGEKCVDALAGRNLTATTSPGGAGKWRDEYAETLRGRRVVILPDNDPPGMEHAEAARRSLSRAAADVRVVILPGRGDKGDVADWLANGGSRGALLSLAGLGERAVLEAVLR